MKKIAVVTGASGGMGIEITRALARSGHHVVMACRNMEKAAAIRDALIIETGNPDIETVELNLSVMSSVSACVDEITARFGAVELLMNNAGTISRKFEKTIDGFENTVATNYMGHFLLTRRLSELMRPGSRIVNMVSCTYRIGRLRLPEFFTNGKVGSFNRMAVYANTKLALMLFTAELGQRLKNKGIYVGAADPGVVATEIIYMDKWFDPLARIFFTPFIRKPAKGAASALQLLIKGETNQITRCFCVNSSIKKIPNKILRHPLRRELWEKTEEKLKEFIS